MASHNGRYCADFLGLNLPMIMIVGNGHFCYKLPYPNFIQLPSVSSGHEYNVFFVFFPNSFAYLAIVNKEFIPKIADCSIHSDSVLSGSSDHCKPIACRSSSSRIAKLLMRSYFLSDTRMVLNQPIQNCFFFLFLHMPRLGFRLLNI